MPRPSRTSRRGTTSTRAYRRASASPSAPTLTYWHAALDPRITAVAHLCCYADYATLVELGDHDNHGIYLLVPGLLHHTSTGEIAGLVAPRAQLICLGDEDELTPPLSIERALAVTRPMYETAGAAEASRCSSRRASTIARRRKCTGWSWHSSTASSGPSREVCHRRAGSRHQMYRDALVEKPIDPANELVALCDTNPSRLALAAAQVPNRDGPASRPTAPTSSTG